MTNEKELNETSKIEEIEATTLKYEEKLVAERKEKDANLKAYLKEKREKIDLQEENNRLKEKLEAKTLENLRGKEIERKTQNEKDNLVNTLFGG